MIFGKIDYLNLLPLHIYLKKAPLPNGFKAAMEHKKGVPSKINRSLRLGLVDAGIISSIQSTRARYARLDLGICARGEVRSVLIDLAAPDESDPSSASSNALARVLGLRGRVIIGDRALRLWLDERAPAGDKKSPAGEGGAGGTQSPPANSQSSSSFFFKKNEGEVAAGQLIDLCQVWQDRTGLPFVFARFSCVRGRRGWERLLKKFDKQKIKIPGYILDKYAADRGVGRGEIKKYLNECIYYRLGPWELRGLNLFLRLVGEG